MTEPSPPVVAGFGVLLAFRPDAVADGALESPFALSLALFCETVSFEFRLRRYTTTPTTAAPMTAVHDMAKFQSAIRFVLIKFVINSRLVARLTKYSYSGYDPPFLLSPIPTGSFNNSAILQASLLG